jgi:pyridoxal phosphate enzyme (YggS family)
MISNDHPMTTDIKSNLKNLQQTIALQADQYGRDARDIRLLAVSKTFPARDIQMAHEAGQHAFGENYVSEALEKISSLSGLDIEWHYIGPIQGNKTKKIAENFHWVHSLASPKHARRLSEQRPPDLPPLNVCIQVNISGEANKSGISPDDLHALASQVHDLPRLCLRGIMGIPAPTKNFEMQRQAFASLANLYMQLQQTYDHIDTLSMGMSGDMEAAIAEGTTMVRIGTAIFGLRNTGKDFHND